MPLCNSNLAILVLLPCGSHSCVSGLGYSACQIKESPKRPTNGHDFQPTIMAGVGSLDLHEHPNLRETPDPRISATTGITTTT